MEISRPHWEAWWNGGRPGAMSYSDYTRAVQGWVEQNTHSGTKPSAALAEYTRLNAFRMKRVEKTAKWPPELLELLQNDSVRAQHWIVVTESWCGDAAQTVPLIGAMAERAQVSLDLVLRDAPSGIIGDFLTRGGKSIPKWIVANSDGKVLGEWGPRPQKAQDMVVEYKAQPEPKPEYRDFTAEVQKWYARDRGRTFLEEAHHLISTVKWPKEITAI